MHARIEPTVAAETGAVGDDRFHLFGRRLRACVEPFAHDFPALRMEGEVSSRAEFVKLQCGSKLLASPSDGGFGCGLYMIVVDQYFDPEAQVIGY